MDPALRALESLPRLPFAEAPSPLEPMDRLRAALSARPRLLVKRDDAIAVGFGGNKIRKLRLVAARALAAGADTLVTTGGVQSNHCRATAAVAAKLGLGCVIVANGVPQPEPTANALLEQLLGAEVEYVATREERNQRLDQVAARLAADGRRPFVIPLGASTPLGALAFVEAITELLRQTEAPDVIVHATSSGGTQAGLAAGCALHGLKTRVVGISADDPAPALAAKIRGIIAGMGEWLPLDAARLATTVAIEVDDGFVGGGYGVATDASREAQRLAARTEALFVDHTYTAKALAGLISYSRSGRFDANRTVLFWHTGGQLGLFA